MFLLGYDIGSSSVKASLLDAETGKLVASASSPQVEMEISAPRPGWAEQDPEKWWEHVRAATVMVGQKAPGKLASVEAVGIAYQMHGLVVVGHDGKALRPAIIWCDSRAVEIGEQAFSTLGRKQCLQCLLNSPGNFTASKLRWVMENEPDVIARAEKFMLPGDFVALKMTGEACTSRSGLSEGVLWDFASGGIAEMVLGHYKIPRGLIPNVVNTFSVQGEITRDAAAQLGLRAGTKVSYRAGDQPNNALSLKVLHPGEIASTAGTSGVVYGVTEARVPDAKSRVNIFLHVNDAPGKPRYGVLACVNGAGILNRWLKGQCWSGFEGDAYREMNALAATVPPGSRGIRILPYGNGAERTLENRDIGASVRGLQLNIHTRADLARAVQESIAFAMNYGVGIMRSTGLSVERARAGRANMFLSPVFGEIFAAVTGASLEIFDTDGSQGAARGAGIGAGVYKNMEEAFVGLEPVRVIEPSPQASRRYADLYSDWVGILQREIEMKCL